MKVGVYGATGHTGALVCEALAARGLDVLAAGRDAGRLALGAAPWRQVGLEDHPGLVDFCAQVELVIHCAGPFITLGPPLARAAVEVGVHFFDLTGEQPWVRWLEAHLHESAKERGVILASAMGIEVMVADALAARVGQGGVRRIHVVNSTRDFSASRGTRLSALEVAARTPQVWEDGARRERPALSRRRQLDPDEGFHGGAIWIPGVEHLSIPRHVEVGTVEAWASVPGPLARLSRPASRGVELLRGRLGRAALRVARLDRRGASSRRAPFRVAVTAIESGWRRQVVDGVDPYRSSAVLVAWAAESLGRNGPHVDGGGVRAPAEVVDPDAVVQQLLEQGATLREEHGDGPA